jgi:predicted TIM-barrel enzyme
VLLRFPFDAVMFCNEGDRPYSLRAGFEGVAVMARVAADLAPVLANTGAKAGNVASFLEVADGIIVGSDLKEDGGTWNPVDPERVKRFLEAAGRA